MKQLPKFDELQPEQREVITNITTQGKASDIIYVQGVAGSGKTTIALHTARYLGSLNPMRAANTKATILFLTYNQRLTDYCANILTNQPEVVNLINRPEKEATSSKPFDLRVGMVNVLTIQEFFKLALPIDLKDRCLDDEQCISKIGEIAGNRGITELLPSQIFSLITTFLRGKPELINLSVDELEEKIKLEMKRSAHYRVYGTFLQEIRQRLLKTYEDWKSERFDRSGVASYLHTLLKGIEGHLNKINALQALDIRTQSRKHLGDQSTELFQTMSWLKEVMQAYQKIPKFESEARTYTNRFDGHSLGEADWNELRGDLFNWLPQYGLRSPVLFNPLISKLSNPIIIVDEVQDLSAIECENLISLWYQLPKANESRLVLLGDLNQQMTPSGFEWTTLFSLASEKRQLFNYPYHQSDNLHFLANNYRTTEQIASAVSSMLEQVAKKSLAPDIAERFLKHAISPSNTLPINLADKIEEIVENEGEEVLTPKMLIGSRELFEEGLILYIKEMYSDVKEPDEYSLLSTVVITEHSGDLDLLLGKEENHFVLESKMLEVIPLMSCKGLEFDRCVLYGLSKKKTGPIETDLIASWYTAFTRAKLLLLIFLNEDEFQFVKDAGWLNMPDETILVRKAQCPQDVVNAIRSIGSTELDADALWAFGRRYLALFKRTRSETYLKNSLSRLKEGGWQQDYKDASWEGGTHFESVEDFEKAAFYFQEAEAYSDQIRCLNAYREWLLTQNDTLKASQVLEEMHIHIDLLDPGRMFDKAACWIILAEYEKALLVVAQAPSEDRRRVTEMILEKVDELSESRRQNTLPEIAELFERFNYLADATQAWGKAGIWRKAMACASRVDEATLRKISESALNTIEDLEKRHKRPEAILISELLDEYRQFDLAFEGWRKLKKQFNAFKSLISASKFEKAEKLLPDILESETQEAFLLLGKGYFKQGFVKYPSAYRFFTLAGSEQHCRRIELECKQLNRHVILAQCFSEVDKKDEIRELAHQLEVAGRADSEVAAQCWELIGEWNSCKGWENAARCWMDAYFREIDAMTVFLGPNPALGLSTLGMKRFYDNLEDKKHYDIPLDEWAKLVAYVSGEQAQLEQVARIIERVSVSPEWRKDFEQLMEKQRYTIQRANLDMTLPRVLTPAQGIKQKSVEETWQVLRKNISQLWDQAAKCADEAYRQDPMAGISIMKNTCNRSRAAEDMSNRLKERNKRLWIKSLKILDLDYDPLDLIIRQYDLIRETQELWDALSEFYSEDATGLTQAKTKFRNRLINVYQAQKKESVQAEKLLKYYFPDYQIPEALKVDLPAGEQREIKISNADLSNLMADLLSRSDLWGVSSVTRSIIQNQARNMLESNIDIADQWDVIKKLMPESIGDEEKCLLHDIETVVKATIVECEAQVGQGLDQNHHPENVYKSTDESESKIGVSRPRRRSRRTPIQQGELIEIDLHGYSLDEAMKQFQLIWGQIKNDKTKSGLLLIHGYGKDKGPSVIQKEIRRELRRIRSYGRVRKVILGEKLNTQREDWTKIKQTCPDLDLNEYGENNPGITFVWFKVG